MKLVLGVLLILWQVLAVFGAEHSLGVHWPIVQPGALNISVVDKTDRSWAEPVAIAVRDWSVSQSLDLYLTRGQNVDCLFVTDTVQVCNARYGSTGWYGLMQFVTEGEHLRAATVKFNESYKMSRGYRELIACHELGHAVGLGHRDETFNNPQLGTCLDYSTQADYELNLHPDAHDYAMLEQIYAHVDTAAVQTPVEPEIVSRRFDRKEELGRVIAVKSKGRFKEVVYERRFRKQKVISMALLGE
jgi:hypothetical protein